MKSESQKYLSEPACSDNLYNPDRRGYNLMENGNNEVLK